MDPNHRLDERFNLNNYRVPNHRRSTVSSPAVQPSTGAAHQPTAWSLPPGTVRTPSNFPFNDNELRFNASPRDMHRNVPTAHVDMDIQPGYFTHQPSVRENFAPHGGHSTFTSGTPPTVPTAHSTFASTSNYGIHNQPIPTPSSPLVPGQGRLAAKLMEKLDLLASRQDLVFNYAKEALIARKADATQQAEQAQQNTAPDSSAVDGIKATAQAITALAERMEGLAADVSAIRDILGIPAEAPEHELCDGVRYMKKRRLSKQAVSAQPTVPGIPVGATSSNAIVVDEVEEGPTLEQEAGRSRRKKGPVGQRSIMDRLDSMEADFAEFMERVRDPNANMDELRGLSSNGIAKSDPTRVMYDAGSGHPPATRYMRDVRISPRTPSPPLIVAPSAVEVDITHAADNVHASQPNENGPAALPLQIQPDDERDIQHAPGDPHDLNMLMDADSSNLPLAQGPTSTSLSTIPGDMAPLVPPQDIPREEQMNDADNCVSTSEEQSFHGAPDHSLRGELSPMNTSVDDNSSTSIAQSASPDVTPRDTPPLSLAVPGADMEQDEPCADATAVAESAPCIPPPSHGAEDGAHRSPIVQAASLEDTLPAPSLAVSSAEKRDTPAAQRQVAAGNILTGIPPIHVIDDSDEDGHTGDPRPILKATCPGVLPSSTMQSANAKDSQLSSKGQASRNATNKHSPWIPPIAVLTNDSNGGSDRNNGPSLALPGGSRNKAQKGPSSSRAGVSMSSTTFVQRPAAPASAAQSDIDNTPSPDIEPARPLKRLKRCIKSPSPTLPPSAPPLTRKAIPPPIIPWSEPAPRKSTAPPPALNRREKVPPATPAPAALSRTPSARAGTPERRAGEQQRPRPQWHSKPSTAALRDLSEVKIGPPRKARPVAVPAKGAVATTTGQATAMTKGQVMTTARNHAAATPTGGAVETPRRVVVVNSAAPSTSKRSHVVSAAPRVGDGRGGVDSAKKTHRVEKRKWAGD
ncbi:hypothetical protein HYPSUDRAFT_199727 [Hypholoma sublateritium FD-334 SS-4]|uniref:Uncharacterized protein n=1 Tax=Hypholoma sublateritium (strain FD-334 SS-4) TaxID=945553 RepID=A0A0D2MNV7_HYPSF|nr:hypothetical protein HYPSUDRAFT_199727 [Hypholoma sublateritium FD-334 SS-4]